MTPATDIPNRPKPSDLIVFDPRTSRLRFVVFYVPYPGDVFKFKIICRQVGVDGKKIPGTAMIDFVVNDIFNEELKTIEHISLFFRKLILVECGVWYKYQDHIMLNDDSVNIAKWISWFNDITRVASFSSEGLDTLIACTVPTPAVATVESVDRVEPVANPSYFQARRVGLQNGLQNGPARSSFNVSRSGGVVMLPPITRFTAPSNTSNGKRRMETMEGVLDTFKTFTAFTTSTTSGQPSFKKILTVAPAIPAIPAIPIMPAITAIPAIHVNPNPVNPVQSTYDQVFSTSVSIKAGGSSFSSSISSEVTLKPIIDRHYDDDSMEGLPFTSDSFGLDGYDAFS